MTITDNAVYVDGRRTDNPQNLEETYEVMRDRGGMAWIGLYRPGLEEIRSVADEFSLHELAIEDALTGHLRSKLERHGDTLFMVLRAARYLDDVGKVEFGELHVFVGADFVVTVGHAHSPNLVKVRHRLEAAPELLALGPQAVLYAILDEAAKQYEAVAGGLETDIDEIEDELFSAGPDTARRIYKLSREVIEFQGATHTLRAVLEALERGAEKYHLDLELQRRLRDVHDHVMRVVDLVDTFRVLLQSALTVHATFVARQRNEEVKKVFSWAAILFTSALVGTLYRMNFDFMPGLAWPLGYPFVIGLMLAMGVVLYLSFRHRKWL